MTASLFFRKFHTSYNGGNANIMYGGETYERNLCIQTNVRRLERYQ